MTADIDIIVKCVTIKTKTIMNTKLTAAALLISCLSCQAWSSDQRQKIDSLQEKQSDIELKKIASKVFELETLVDEVASRNFGHSKDRSNLAKALNINGYSACGDRNQNICWELSTIPSTLEEAKEVFAETAIRIELRVMGFENVYLLNEGVPIETIELQKLIYY